MIELNKINSIWYSEYHGDYWENICNILLALKHGADYQPISDKGGDMGLDGLVVAQGIVYQAYGQEYENKDPVKGIQGKVHKDLAKLKKEVVGIAQLLGDKKICRWVLLLNKEIPSNLLHAYLKVKQDEVLSWGLPFISPMFQVLIQPPSYLQSEYLEYAKKKDNRIEVEMDRSSAPSMDGIKKNNKFMIVLEKFEKIVDSDAAEKLAYEQVKQYIENSTQLDRIQKQEPEFFKEIEEIRSDVETDAISGSLLAGNYGSMSNTQNILETRLNIRIGNRLGGNTLGRVRKYIIADWFVRCPLNFKTKEKE